MGMQSTGFMQATG